MNSAKYCEGHVNKAHPGCLVQADPKITRLRGVWKWSFLSPCLRWTRLGSERWVEDHVIDILTKTTQQPTRNPIVLNIAIEDAEYSTVERVYLNYITYS